MSEATSTEEIQRRGSVPALPSRYQLSTFEQSTLNAAGYLPRATNEQMQDHCPVCLDEFLDSEVNHVPVITPCNHVFGRSCLHKWFTYSHSCPMCRMQLIEFDVEEYWQQPGQTIYHDDHLAFFWFMLTDEGVRITEECNTRRDAMDLLYGHDWNVSIVEDDRDMALEAARWAQTRSQLRVAAGLDPAEEIDREIACLMLLIFDGDDFAAIERCLPSLEEGPFDMIQVMREIREATEVRDHFRFLRWHLGLLDQTDEVRGLLTNVARHLSAREHSVRGLWASIERH